jgi:hypothetical protein
MDWLAYYTIGVVLLSAVGFGVALKGGNGKEILSHILSSAIVMPLWGRIFGWW